MYNNFGAFQEELLPAASLKLVFYLFYILYGCETWLLDTSCLSALESFQCEIGRRILRLPKHYSGNAVRIGLHWSSMSTRIFLRKILFLSKFLCNSKDTLCSRVFISLEIEDIHNTSIVQQCRMLESQLGTDTVAQCLNVTENDFSIAKSSKKVI